MAVAGPGIVTLLAFTDTRGVIPGLLYVLAVAGTAALGGTGLGSLAAIFALVPFDYFFTGEPDHFGASAGDVVAALAFLVTGLGAGWLIERERRARFVADTARAEALAAARVSRRLQRAAEALSVAVTPEEVLDAVMTESVAAADARAGLIALLSADGTRLEIAAQRGYRSELMTKWRSFPLDADFPLSHAVRTGEHVFLSSERERKSRFQGPTDTGEHTHALVCLPLVVEDRTIGGITFSFADDQEFDEERRAMKAALARQAAQALDRARLYDAVRTAEARVSFLGEVTRLLSSSLDYESTLERLAQVSIPRLTEACAVDIVDDDGAIRRVAIAHDDPTLVAKAWELYHRFPHDPDAPTGVPHVIRTGQPEFLPKVPKALIDEAAARNPEVAEILETLSIHSWMCVPLRASGRVFGALSFLAGRNWRRRFTDADLELAIAIADRAAVAIENARLYRETERRAEAARALAYVGDAVVLLDRFGVIRFWNSAAEEILGVPEPSAVGRPVHEVVVGWDQVRRHVRAATAGSGETARPQTVPLAMHGVERWLSTAAVDFGDGSVYALRDVTSEHALEQARSEFVATASHELRTPLTSVYGAIRTLRRVDVDIGDENKQMFLEIIERETERLNIIVNQLLVAGQLESGALRLGENDCDLRDLIDEVVSSARLRAPEAIHFEVTSDEFPVVRQDEEKLRQVLVNIVENAIKYSPGGGSVTIDAQALDGLARIEVHDHGLGIEPADHERIFEKFARLDPGLRRGVGGSGLGLYIARELIRRMGGEILLESAPGTGSTFTIELPFQAQPAAIP